MRKKSPDLFCQSLSVGIGQWSIQINVHFWPGSVNSPFQNPCFSSCPASGFTLQKRKFPSPLPALATSFLIFDLCLLLGTNDCPRTRLALKCMHFSMKTSKAHANLNWIKKVTWRGSRRELWRRLLRMRNAIWLMGGTGPLARTLSFRGLARLTDSCL